MRKDKDKAIQLRKQGKSYKEIRNELHIPLGTLSEWFSSLEWSRNISDKLNLKNQVTSTSRIQGLNGIRGRRLKKIYEDARADAVTEFELLKSYPLFIAGLMVYWGEGDKKSKYALRVSNTDPLLIKLYISFILRVFRIPASRIRVWMLLYPDLNETDCKEYWKKQLSVGDDNFYKTSIISGRHKISRLSYGVCTAGFSSRYAKEKLLIWLKLAAEYLTK